MTNPTADPLVGRTVAQYEIVSRLGGGGMGVVYRAIDHKLGRTVALKFLPPQWGHDDDAKQRFIREAQAASATHHPNICTIHDIETADEGQLFIVMAYYEGPTLKQRLEGGPLPIEEALDIATQIADGLGKAHGQGIVHRDIKPGNLILTEDGVRIVDFGLATFADALQLTASGSTLGTAAYMSPEQSRGQDADARTDVWAAGVVLYEMLAGHPPFRGSYAEAIAYAIRNDAPAALRTERPEVPEEVEQVVFRALHKDPAIRFQGGRELGRALRQSRGLTLPQDLRTQTVVTNVDVASAVRRTEPRLSLSRRRIAAAAAVVALLVGTPAWLFIPVDRVTVAVTPVVNRTGFSQLNGFEFALQEELAAALRDSRAVHVVNSDRVREILRPYRLKTEATGPEALEAVRQHTGARILLVPMLFHENGEWSARLDVWNTESGTRDPTLATAPITSAVNPETAYELNVQLASLVNGHFVRQGPLRAFVIDRIRTWTKAKGASLRRFRTVAAATAFERGLEAYDRLEYASALKAFTEAIEHDPDNPLSHAWRSRTALVMRRDAEARDAAKRALSLPLGEHGEADTLFVRAVAAEAQGQFDDAEVAYRSLVELDEQNPRWLLEQAAYLERRGKDSEAVEAYVAALALDGALAGPEVELCRLFGPTRLNDVVRAKQHADEARRKYAAIGSLVGEALAAMCLADTLRVGSPQDRGEASRQADLARQFLERLEASYQLPRALYYIALTAFWQDRFRDAVAWNEKALEAAEAAGNTVLEPFVYQNLGAAHSRLGNRRQYIGYTRLGADLFAARGDNERAAGMQANAGAALIDFGDDPEEGFRLVQNSLKVFQNAQSSDREVFTLQVSAAYHRYAGRHVEAERLLDQAMAVSQHEGLKENLWQLRMDRARSRFELGDYLVARELVASGLEGTSGRARNQAQIWLAQIETRLGQFSEARARLASAASSIDPQDVITQLLLSTASGELEYESDRRAEALVHFRRAARTWNADLPHARSVEALVYEGWLDMLSGDVARGRAALEKGLAQAKVMGRANIETRSRIFLARTAIMQRRFADAIQVLSEVAPDDEKRTIGPELRSQVHYWAGQALIGRGDSQSGDAEILVARKALDAVRMRLPENTRNEFGARIDVRRILQ